MPKAKIKIPSTGYITCSQLGSLYGCGFVTKDDVYCRYKGIVRDVKIAEDSQRSMEFGKAFEDSVAQFFCKQRDLKVKKEGNGEMAYWAKDMPYFICHPDRIGVGRDAKGRRFALEVKCVSPHSKGWGDEGTEEVPDYYYLQCQGYFACGIPCDIVYLACMRGNRVYVYEILPDEDVIADIKDKVKKAKEDFDNDIVPKAETYDEALSQLLRKVDLERDGMPAGDEGRQLWADMLANHAVLNGAKAEEERLKAKMTVLMGNAPAIITADDGKISTIARLSETHKTVFDDKALKKEMPEVYKKYAREQVSKSVRFSWPKDTKKEE